MIRQHPDDPARPWELAPARPQTADDVTPASVADGPWHEGGRYHASAANAAFWRRLHRERLAADAARHARTAARIAERREV